MNRPASALVEAARTDVRRFGAAVFAAGLLLAVLPGRAQAIGPKFAVGPRAELAVQGTVVGRSSAWDSRHQLIYTYTKVRVERELKGDAPRYITIKQSGGQVGTLRLTVTDQPQLYVDERVRVYLSPDGAGALRIVDGPGSLKRLDKAGARRLTPAASGYEWDGTKWDNSDLPMAYYVNTAFDATERSVLQTSFSTWQDDAGSSMEYVYAGTTTRGGPTYDGYNVMTKGSTGGSIATTYYWSTGGRMIEADIVYDYTAWPWSTSGEPGAYDLQNIATHEIGHTLVLGDLYDGANVEQTMYGYADLGETYKRTLNWGDIVGIAAIYPDTGPPPNVSGLTATSGDRRITLSWRNPSAADFAGVRIVRKTGSAPASLSDGTEIYNGGGTRWTDTGLTNRTMYYYRAFAYDLDGHTAIGVTVSARPRPTTSLTFLALSGTITWGGATRVRSTIVPAHAAVHAITLRQSTDGSDWSTLDALDWNATTNAYEAVIAPKAKTYYRSAWNGDWDHLSAVSPAVLVSVRPKLATGLSALSLRYGGTIRVSGYVYPRHDGKACVFYYERYASGAWGAWTARYTRLAYNSSSRSKASSSYRPPRGTWRVRFRFGDTDHTATQVYSRTFAVR